MKKTIGSILTIFSIFILSACSQTDLHERLQENNWNVVSTHGEAYEAQFSETTYMTEFAGFTAGGEYSVDNENNQIIFYRDIQGEQEVMSTYNVTDVSDEELKLISADEETTENFGNLTLIPIEEGQDQS